MPDAPRPRDFAEPQGTARLPGGRGARAFPPPPRGGRLPQPDQATVRNGLLAALAPDDFALLAPALHPVELAFKQALNEPDRPIAAVHFPEGGMVSLLAGLEGGEAMEVGLVGREGLVGLPALLGDGRAGTEAVVQAQGAAWRAEAAALKAAFDESAGVRAVLLRYAQAFHAQVAQSAACNGRHGLEERLARWILMAHDRVDGDAFPMTQEFMALMLGVRRAGVSVAAGMLQKAGAIAHGRGRVTVLDRPGLEAAACGCYGTVRRQFERLLGVAAGE
jgi:CRP-like cAMP-binding protein